VNPPTISFSAGLSGLGPDHPAVRAATEELLVDLSSGAGLTFSDGGTPEPGTKGWVHDLMFAAGSTGAIGSVVRIFHLWLKRDRRRSLTLSKYVDGGHVLNIEITGDPISEETVRAAIERLTPSSPIEPPPADQA
jgi:hypothetical protein